MAKNIIFCADGTWNKAGDEIDSDSDAPSNVFKLFTHLAGKHVSKINHSEITGRVTEYEKSLIVDTATLQIAKYINGVGNSSLKINKILGGAFGFGLIERIARGYTFISRNYVQGDKIFIVGFSRGAYTARALAGLIANKGLLAKKFNQGEEESYDMAVRAWYSYRAGITQTNYQSRLQNLFTAFTSIKNYVLQNTIQESDFIKDINIEAVAVWDTVGALGIPDFEFDDNRAEIRDGFAFADNALNPKVKRGFHAIAIDEMRLLFRPTLWDKRDGIQQYLFAGAHADVGGGYKEAGLSDIALRWMIDLLGDVKVGVKFADTVQNIKGDIAAIAHKEWAALAGVTGELGARQFKTLVQNGTLHVHQSVVERRNLAPFKQYAGEAASKYNPSNI
jgi:uncharacterized protein (DUF2235 family)